MHSCRRCCALALLRSKGGILRLPSLARATSSSAAPAPNVRQIISSTPVDTAVTVTGWIRSARVQKQYSFLEMTDGSGPNNLQVVWPTEGAGVLEGEKRFLSTGSSVRVEGKLVASPKPGQRVEVLAERVTIIGPADPVNYPLQKKVRRRTERGRDEGMIAATDSLRN
jgi:aspartyl/asparaginyl-tRNA synthetase